MKSIVYLTTNKYKLREAELVLHDKYGFDIEIVNRVAERLKKKTETEKA